MRCRLLWATALLFAFVFPAAAQADHAFLPNRFPAPKVGSPPLPLNALTGFESKARSFKDACGLAVQAGGLIYVSDHGHDVIDSFNSEGRYQGSLEDQDPLGGPCGLALDSLGNLYANDYRRAAVKYPSDGFGGYLAPVTVDSGPATGVAVDLSTNRLYVTHSTYVAVYEPNGLPVMDGPDPLHIGAGSLTDAYGAAVSGFAATKGRLYIADAADETVKAFDPAIDKDNPAEAMDGSLGPQQGFRDLGDAALAIDQSTGNLLVTDRLAGAEEPPIVVDELSPSGNFRGQLRHAISGGEPAGIAVDPGSGDVYVTTGRRDEAGVYAFGPAAPSHALLLTKAGTGQGTVTSTPVGISCPAGCPAGEAEFALGSNVTLKATAAPHSAFTGWSVAGQPAACPGTISCQVSMSADTEVIASFSALPQQTLTVTKSGSGEGTVESTPAGIDCGSVCSAQFDQGSTVTLSATPSAHSTFAGWSLTGDPSACKGTGPCEVSLAAATQVSATFTHNPDRTLSVSVSGQGKVTSTPAGIDCPGSCTHAFAEGTEVSLQAIPAPGYQLSSWSAPCSGRRGCVVAMEADRALSATFTPIEDPFAVSVIGAGTGTVSDPAAGIECGLTCAGIYRLGTVLHLSAKAEAGSRFIGFAGCDAFNTTTCTVTVSAAKTVTALFGEAPEISVRRALVKGNRATLKVSVPAPGLLEATGKGITKAKARAKSEGTLSLVLALNPKGRATLQKTKGKGLTITVSLLFTSADGSTAKATKTVSFKDKGARR